MTYNKLLKNIPSFPGQHTFEGWFQASPTVVSTTVTTGVISTDYDVNAAAIVNWNTRFQVTFREYRIIRARFRTRNFSTVNPGVFATWFDEKSTATPTSNEAQDKATKLFSCADVIGNHSLEWTAHDPLDLQYTISTTTNVTPVSFKIYTNNANFGSSIVATQYADILPEFYVQFRGLYGV